MARPNIGFIQVRPIAHNLRSKPAGHLRPIGYVCGMATQKKPRNPDHVRRVNVLGPQDEVLQAQFKELLTSQSHPD